MNVTEIKKNTSVIEVVKQGLWKATVQADFSSCTPKHNNGTCLFAIRRERKAIAKSDYHFFIPHRLPVFWIFAWNNVAPTGRILVKFWGGDFY